MSSDRLSVVRRDGLGHHDWTGDPTPKNPRRRRLPSPVAGDVVGVGSPTPMSQKWRREERAELLAEQRAAECARHQQRLMRKVNRDTPTEDVPPTKIRQPRTEQACTHRRRAYVKHALRCLYGRKRKPKYVPSWWRDESLRQAAIAAAFA